MLGLAIGDALGAPLEGMKAGHIRQLFGEVTDYLDTISAFPDKPTRWLPRGLYTDDTQQALAVAEVLAVQGEADPAVLSDIYVRLANEGPDGAHFGSHRGTGHFFRRAVQAMIEGREPLRCGQNSAGNGAAMRIAPVGLYCADDEEAMVHAVVEFSLLTHHDIRGVAAALAVARVVALFAGGRDSDAVAAELPDWLAGWEDRVAEDYAEYLDPPPPVSFRRHMSECLRVLSSLLREADDLLAEKSVVLGAQRCEPVEPIAQAHAGFAPASVVMSIYRALSAKSFSEGLIAAVNAGGDADTVGAMTGAMLGARFGAEAVPAEWLEGLRNAAQIRARGQAMLDKTVDWSVWGDLVEFERELTREEMDLGKQGLSENSKVLEKKRRKQDQLRAKREQKPKARDLGFAPPPEIWLRDAESEAEALDPREAKREKAQRGRKRIPWKDERRKKGKSETVE
jgi:ADP-ribosylglycohydrolase